MSKHTQPILFFGLILPAIAVVALATAVLMGRSKLVAQKESKSELLETFKEASTELSTIEGEMSVEGRRDQMEYWESQLKKEFVQSLTQNLNEITEQFSEEQLIRTELSRPTARSPLAGSTDNPHSRFKLSFEGGFGPMQMALAELELRMPQLVLESLEIKPQTSSSTGTPKLSFEATYLAWHDISDAARN
ncbi:MAG: hypothetical protein KDN19_07270 [Verrucomicrobiae bacterium]|nr:hypothetical protein [Verrucomicrobiae bacterium]